MEIVIIGGGVAGITAGINSLTNNNHVTILERYDKCLKKLLVTGNGKCNYWNSDFNINHFYGDRVFLDNIINNKNKQLVNDFFNKLGLIPRIKDGYYYPMSMQASSVRNAFLSCTNDIDIILNANVYDILKDNNKFIIYYNDTKIICDKLIIATGSNSYYKDNTYGYNLCKKLGHDINKVLPALTQVVSKDNFSDLKGIRVTSNISLYVNHEFIKSNVGELQFTDYGLSGICIFNLSSIISKSLYNKDKIEVKINFVPEIDNLLEYLDNRSKYYDNSLYYFLETLINNKLLNYIIKRSKVDEHKKWNDLTRDEKNIIINNITNFSVSIVDTKSFDSSQVSTGGVDTNLINYSNMESKVVKNLYIVGEVLDVDGECGGFNIGFAILSGILAGMGVRND